MLAAVSKNLDYLVVGENPGSKLTASQAIGYYNIKSKRFRGDGAWLISIGTKGRCSPDAGILVLSMSLSSCETLRQEIYP